MKRILFVTVMLLFFSVKNALVASDNDFFGAKPCALYKSPEHSALCGSPAHESLAALQELVGSKLANSKKKRPASCILFSGHKPSSRRRSLENLKKDASEY